MNTTTSTGYRYTNEERAIAHADHAWEEWHAYLSCDDETPEQIEGDESGICCHTCMTIVVDSRVYDDAKSASDPCQRGTEGCSIDHSRDVHDSCATY